MVEESAGSARMRTLSPLPAIARGALILAALGCAAWGLFLLNRIGAPSATSVRLEDRQGDAVTLIARAGGAGVLIVATRSPGFVDVDSRRVRIGSAFRVLPARGLVFVDARGRLTVFDGALEHFVERLPRAAPLAWREWMEVPDIASALDALGVDLERDWGASR